VSSRRLAGALCAALLVVSRGSLAQSPAPAAEYEDRLIDSGNLKPLASEHDEGNFNTSGLARQWRVEGFASRIEQGANVRHENGMVMSGRLETLEYGVFSVDATVRNGTSSSVFTLWQRGLAFDNGWIANNGAGMLNTPTIELARQQYRFFIPTFPIVGAQTEWIRNGELQLQAGYGSPGLYNGLRLAGFSRLGGQVATGGAQWSLEPQVQVGFQVADARDVEAGVGDEGAGKTTARSFYGAIAWASGDDRMQFNVIDSKANAGRHNLGTWFDAETRSGRLRQNYGAFRFEPDMSWGHIPINRDLLGGYYRVNYSSQQWIWAAGLDSVSSVTGRGLDANFLTGNARYQADRSLGVGGGGTLRHGDTAAGTIYGFLDKQSAFGTTRLQVDLVAAEGSQRGEQLTVDHAWPTQVGLRLSTSLALAQETERGARTTRASVAAFGGIDITNNLTVEGNVRVSLDRDTTRTIGKFINLSLVWRITPRWSMVATYYDNRSDAQPFATIAPVVPIDVVVPGVPRDRAVFITVRYEDHAGTPVAPLGGAPGSGAGRIMGTLFYDANDDGRRGANEAPAANVTVLLDGKFATRTDSEGRFEFPFVASGPHSLAVVPDNLALPYSVANDGRRTVMVSTRETTMVDIAAVKQP
jgi:hypothetical protein